MDLADVTHTLAVGRRGHEYRRALVCKDIRDAAMTLMLGDDVVDGHVDGIGVDVVFVFPDQLSTPRFGWPGPAAAPLPPHPHCHCGPARPADGLSRTRRPSGLGGRRNVPGRRTRMPCWPSFSLGFDSLDLIDIASKLGAELDMDMPVALFGEHPTIDTYVANLAEASSWPTRVSG
jgi:hypothetical protein